MPKSRVSSESWLLPYHVATRPNEPIPSVNVSNSVAATTASNDGKTDEGAEVSKTSVSKLHSSL